MDKGTKEFDKFIRNKVSDVEFSGEKDSWELLNYLLKQQTRRKQRIRGVAFLFLLLAVASAAWLFIPSKKKESDVGGSNRQELQIYLPQINSAENHKEENSGKQKREEHLQSSPEKIITPENNIQENAEKPILDETATAPVNKEAEKNNSAAIDFYSAMNTYAWGSDSFKIEITNVGDPVNSSYSDFAPVISSDGATMFFTSRRPIKEKEIKHGKQTTEHVFTSTLSSKNKWTGTFMLPGAINMDGRNNSVIWLSNDGKRMLLYRDDIYGNGDIYESVLNGAGWTTPVIMDAPVNTKYHESSACISPDGKTLYFISDRPGGIGGRDIWYCTLDKNGQWSNATNMGATVNTPLDEEGIFIYSDGKTMYFSSKGHDGFGGYDIYRTILENGTWSVPVNLGKPLNTSGDDVYFVMEANGTTGYYTSSGQGDNGEKDIYKVTFLWAKTGK